MARSLCVSPSHITTVKQAFKNSPYPNQQAFATECGFGRDTIRKFLNGKPINRLNFIELCEHLDLDWQELIVDPNGDGTEFDPEFVGRDDAIEDLDRLVAQGDKCIVILSPGGRGKTTLAWRYLRQRFQDEEILYFPIAKERKDIASIASLVEEQLRKLGEKADSELVVSLERLRQKLISQRFGILIDNLEPALDQFGLIVPEHRGYLELLRVLCNPSVQSVTLITSREKLKESIGINSYLLSQKC